MARRHVASPIEVDEALRVLVYHGGNTVRASKQLGIPDATLRDWRLATHRDRYREIFEREAPKLESIAAQQATELILRSADTEHAIHDRLSELDNLSTKELSELAGALQRVTTSKGINTTKLLELTGRPTQIVEHRDPRQELAGLIRDLGITIDATAEDITDTPSIPAPVPKAR